MKHVFLIGLTWFMIGNLKGQVTNTDDWNISLLNIDTVTETTLLYRDSITVDTFITHQLIFDSHGQLIEKNYAFRTWPNREKEHTSEKYTYNNSGQLIKTEVVNPPLPPILSAGEHKKDSKCIYYNDQGTIDRIETRLAHGTIKVVQYTYESFPYTFEGIESQAQLPSKVDHLYEGQLRKSIRIEYSRTKE